MLTPSIFEIIYMSYFHQIFFFQIDMMMLLLTFYSIETNIYIFSQKFKHYIKFDIHLLKLQFCHPQNYFKDKRLILKK